MGGCDGHGAGGVAHVLKLCGRQQRSGTAIDQVNHAQSCEFFGDPTNLAEISRGFYEKNVYADLVVERHAVQCLLEPVRGDGIRARHNHGIALTRVKRRFQLTRHLLDANDGFARHMAAAFGKELILYKEATHARSFQHSHSSGNICDIAKAGVAISKDRDSDSVHHPGVVVAQLGQRQLRAVWAPKQGCRRRVSARRDRFRTANLSNKST